MPAAVSEPIELRPTVHRARARATSLVGGWSPPAGLRAVRAAVVVPALLAFAAEVIGNPQMATYATFAGFANLVLAAFPGRPRDKFLGHLGLAVGGGILLTVGTAVNGTVVLAGAVTLPVAFIVLMSGTLGPTPAAGSAAAMLAYVLSAASPGTMDMATNRLEGWWLGTAAAAVAIAATSMRRPASPLPSLAAASARALADELRAVADGHCGEDLRASAAGAGRQLRTAFDASPFRPTGLASVDRALSGLVELLAWVDDLVDDTVADLRDLGALEDVDRALLAGSADVLQAVHDMLSGEDVQPDVERLEELRRQSAAAVQRLDVDGPRLLEVAHASFHCRSVAVAVRSVAADALIAARRSDAATVAARRAEWAGNATGPPAGGRALRPDLSVARAAAASVALGNATLRSVTTRNAARGAIAVTAAVVVADLTNVQHGFWVVLGTLSVLRTSATSTGGTATRALLGTTLGVLAGAGIVVVVGADRTVLWAVLPLAVLVAAYTPGVAPFAAGQAAFTAMLVVLYNILVPVGWSVGVVRVEDIGVGCGISLVLGVLLWPRGAIGAFATNLDDAFSTSAEYLVNAVDWALGAAPLDPAAAQEALLASLRLDDAVRAMLSEQGPQRIAKADLWALVGAAQRLRLTAAAVAELPAPPPARVVNAVLAERARVLGAWYRTVADPTAGDRPSLVEDPEPLPVAALDGPSACYGRLCQTFVDQHLRHLYRHVDEVVDPATHLAEVSGSPWWRAPSPQLAAPR